MRRLLAAALCAAALTTSALADEAPAPPPGPADVITQLYELLGAKYDGCSNYTMSDGVLYTFTPELLIEYKKTAAVDFPIIDGDVFYDTQDAIALTGLTVKTLESGAKTAKVEAAFKLGTEDRKLVYTMSLRGTRWEIDDIAWPWRGDSSTLRGVIAEGLKEAGVP